MRRTTTSGLLALALLTTGCATFTTLEPETRTRLEKQFTEASTPRYLRQSLYVTPFFGDGSKRLLTPVLPEDVRLLNDLTGKPINPGPVEAVAPAGSRVRVKSVEFPTSFAVAERLVTTPRTETWVYLQVQGVKGETPLILVLPEEVRTEAEFSANLERYLTTEDPSSVLTAFSAPVREAVLAKRAVPGMSEQALTMSWGPPARVQRAFQGGVRVETWEFPGGRRKAKLQDGRVTDVVDPAAR
ncbi:MAG: hypothetical protein L0Y66_17130 [Myxococcaceae bacterium]|nr:hypothetical protein [Myxococcaceae bacterium]MCI0669173.1 hypothetical protein [Myxococcaceae bacterium]